MKTTATRQTVETAIKRVNRKYGYQLSLKRADQNGKWFNFTLKSPSKVAGSRVSYSGRNLPAASWHAHGYVFDEIFKQDETAVIHSLNKIITAYYGNWKDSNIGSIMYPKYFSETSILSGKES